VYGIMVCGYERWCVRDAVIEPESLISGRYQCGPVIGRGGVAEVRAARDLRLDRPVAIKLLRAEVDHQPAVRRRFEAEARMAARLVHPNVVTVFDTGEHGTRPFIVMERLSGWTLRDQIDRGQLPVPAVRSLAEQVLGALAAAHAAGIVHRDIKPGNILLGPDDQWKVADFGIAKIAESQSADDTSTGMVIGTPAYLAPERFFGADATVGSDLYALGAVLYESLTGQKPLQAPDAGAWATIAGAVPPPPVRTVRPEVDAGLAAAVERCLNKDPAERFPSAAAMTEALSGPAFEGAPTPAVAPTESVEATRPLPAAAQPSYRRRRVLGALAAVALAGVLAAAVGLNAAGGSKRATHHPPTPSTTPASTSSSPSSSPATSAPAATSSGNPHHHQPGQSGGRGKGKGDGNGDGNGND
jgi:serine/threonine-protein kinase